MGPGHQRIPFIHGFIDINLFFRQLFINFCHLPIADRISQTPGFWGGCGKDPGIIPVHHVIERHIPCSHQLRQNLDGVEHNFIRHSLIQRFRDAVDLADTIPLIDELLLHDLFHADVALIDIPDIRDLPR